MTRPVLLSSLLLQAAGAHAQLRSSIPTVLETVLPGTAVIAPSGGALGPASFPLPSQGLSLAASPLLASALPSPGSAPGALPAGEAPETSPAQAAAARALFDGVAQDFGAKDGTPITNIDAILPDVARALGRQGPPALEALFVRPLSMLKAPGTRLATGTNPYGHIAVRYTLPDGREKAMNIVGDPLRELVNFLRPQDYIYGTRNFDSGSEQGGAYNRGMVGLQIWKLPPETLWALDRFYTKLDGQAERGEAKFSLVLAKARNIFRTLFGGKALFGNCALWTSRGFAAARILRFPGFWPKSVWVTLYETYKRKDPSNVTVVSYRRIPHAVHTYGADAEMHGLVAPLRWYKSWKYWELDDFADAVVEVPEGSMTAVVRTRPPKP